MGQIADDAICGMTCCECGIFFMNDKGQIDEHGHPVLCECCWEDDSKIPKATLPEYTQDE